MAKNKKKKVEEIVVEEVIIEPESVLTEEELKDVKEDEIIDVIISEETPVDDETSVEDTVIVEETIDEVVEMKTLCRVLLATPTYFVVSKNGVSITINEKNTYKRGDEVIL